MNGCAAKIPTPLEIQRVTEQVLRRPEFGRLGMDGEPRSGWLARLIDWLQTFKVFQSGLSVSLLFKLLLVAGLGVLAFFLVRALIAESGKLKKTLAGGRKRAATVREEESSAEQLGEALGRAEKALADGDSRSAIMIVYRSFIESLADRGLLVLEHWKTGLAYLKECPQSSGPYAVLRQLVLIHNRIVYGHYPYEREPLSRLFSELRLEAEQR